MSDNTKSLQVLEALLAQAKKSGADAADAVFFENINVSMSTRKEMPEGIERSESAGLGLRVWIGAKQAMVSSTDIQDTQELADRAVAMARASTEDAESTLAPKELLAQEPPELDLFDAEEPTPAWLQNQCREVEAAALSMPGITNSEGADAGYSANTITLATSHGFARSYRGSHHSLSVAVVAGEGVGMERDYEFTSARHRGDLDAAEWVGKAAAARTLARMNPRKISTCQVPVVFDPRVGRGLISNIASAINGASVARGTSFLKDRMEQEVAAESVTLIDDPHRLRGLSSKAFDGEGVQGKKRALVENGVLKSWLLDVRTANKLKLATTGNAARGMSTPPSPSSTNLYMEAGTATPQQLVKEVRKGLYVTETFGMGVNIVTGDYSQGAAGFWIENGEITYPVSEITIAGHLSEMLMGLTPANDLAFRYGTNAPTFSIARMTVAGA